MKPSAKSLAWELARAHGLSSSALEKARSKLLRILTNREAMMASYTNLEDLQRSLMKSYTFEAARKNGAYNRYTDVLPYDHSRVRLNQYLSKKSETLSKNSQDIESEKQKLSTNSLGLNYRPFLDSTLDTDYINASIAANFPNLDAFNWRYIVAQGPMMHTCEHFWHMVLQQGVKSIIMLTNFVENHRTKCDVYFPEEKGGVVEFSGLKIKTNAVEFSDSNVFVCRHITVENESQSNGKNILASVHHFHFINWPDHGVPQDPNSVLDLCACLRNHRLEQEAHTDLIGGINIPEPYRSERDSTILVHCSAGIGRSGVFCVINAAVEQLILAGGCQSEAERQMMSENAVDIHYLVSEFRHKRPRMVQTIEQYAFCFLALLYLIEEAIKFQQEKSSISGRFLS